MNYCKIKSTLINQFIRDCFDKNVRIRSFIIYYRGELVADVSIPPYHSTDIQQLYSISKSFTSTACGLLYDKGLLDLDQCVLDLFPNVKVNHPSSHLKQMKIKHLLSMNTGHNIDTASSMFASEDPISTFLNLPIEYEPGTRFLYNSGASYMLSAIIQQITKLSLFDFLKKYLFEDLDIKNCYWGSDQQGINYGGFDLHMSNQDVNKLGRLYLHQGVYHGKQILSKEWISKASSLWSDTSIYEYTFDWKNGYGFHFWMNGTTGYRADGAYGQICLIEPIHNCVFSMFSESNNMQDELSLMQALIDQIQITTSNQDIDVNCYDPLYTNVVEEVVIDEMYRLYPNRWGFDSLTIHMISNQLTLEWVHPQGSMMMKLENKQWTYHEVIGPRLIRKLFLDEKIIIEKQALYASYEYTNEHLMLFIRYVNLPHTHKIIIKRGDGLVDSEWIGSFNFYGNDKIHIKGEIVNESKK